MLLWEDLNKRSAIFVTIGPLNWTFGDLGYGFGLYLDSGLSVRIKTSLRLLLFFILIIADHDQIKWSWQDSSYSHSCIIFGDHVGDTLTVQPSPRIVAHLGWWQLPSVTLLWCSSSCITALRFTAALSVSSAGPAVRPGIGWWQLVLAGSGQLLLAERGNPLRIFISAGGWDWESFRKLWNYLHIWKNYTNQTFKPSKNDGFCFIRQSKWVNTTIQSRYR